MLTRRTFLKLFGASVVGGAALAAYAFAIEPLWRLTTVTHRVRPPNWPTDNKLRIVALADFHACEPWIVAKAYCWHL